MELQTKAAAVTNTCSNTQRRCRLRRSSEPYLWKWCIVIKLLVSLPCVFLSCHGVDIAITMYPMGIIKLSYGQPLEIYCIAENDTANNLKFERIGESINSEIVNSTTRRLYIENIDKGIYTFYCHNIKTRKRCTSRVLVDSLPSNVTDFGCMSKNLDELNCTWSSPETYSVTNYSLSFSINGYEVEPCLAKKFKTYRSCTWSTTSKPRYKQMEDRYYFHLTSCNYLGCNKQNFTIDHFAIVKPDPPDNLRVCRNDTHSVLLQWNIPNNMVHFLPCPVVHRIEYQIDNTAYFRSVDASSLPPNNKTYKFLLSNLPYAHTQYEVRIFIKSTLATDDKFWSDFTFIVFYTASERPQRPPDTIAGAFNQAWFNEKRVIYVYWKQLEGYEEAAANFTYKVVAKQGTKDPQTLQPDKNKSLSYVIVNDESMEAIDVTIWSTNALGSSVNSSYLYIPAKRDAEALKVTSLTQLAYENGTYELSWVGIKDIDNYTLFWCHYNTAHICNGRMNFTVLKPKMNSFIIHVSPENKYQFAIAANTGTKTNGMNWASCDITMDALSLYNFPVMLNHDVPGNSYIKISWTMPCKLKEGIINGYLITYYCPVHGHNNLCDNNLENKAIKYISDPNQMEVNITNLQTYTTYNFMLTLNTTYGLKTHDSASTFITTLEDIPTSPRNVDISDVQSDCLIISWDPPLHKNRIVDKYVIMNNEQKIHTERIYDVKGNARKEVKLALQQGLTNYTLSVQACNTAIGSCSNGSPQNGILVKTNVRRLRRILVYALEFDDVA